MEREKERAREMVEERESKIRGKEVGGTKRRECKRRGVREDGSKGNNYQRCERDEGKEGGQRERLLEDEWGWWERPYTDIERGMEEG